MFGSAKTKVGFPIYAGVSLFPYFIGSYNMIAGGSLSGFVLGSSVSTVTLLYLRYKDKRNDS